jgi:hypothetical protein
MLAEMHVLWDVEVWTCGRVVTDAVDDLFVSIFRVYTISSWTSQVATTRDFCVAIVRDCTEDRDRHFEGAPCILLRNAGNYSSFDRAFHISEDLNSFLVVQTTFLDTSLPNAQGFFLQGYHTENFLSNSDKFILMSGSFPSFMNTNHGN